MFAPMAWRYAAIAFHGFAQDAFMELEHEDPVVVAINGALVAGPSPEETYRTRSFDTMIVGTNLIQFSQA